ncbi:MAG: putative toxin-antitoxin system toxin component, PIN family [Actinobacteria bacterium]|nr:putative toxin-antitoxin system toxin component, PIN family [Actinomycetota bacterium]
MPKVVVDTNILISATVFGGLPDDVLDLARGGEVELVISPTILEEFSRILRAKFSFSPEKIIEALLEIRSLSTMVEPKIKLGVIRNDEPDNRILECAVFTRANYIVSGDTRHLQSLKEYQGIKILSPSEFLRLFK